MRKLKAVAAVITVLVLSAQLVNEVLKMPFGQAWLDSLKPSSTQTGHAATPSVPPTPTVPGGLVPTNSLDPMGPRETSAPSSRSKDKPSAPRSSAVQQWLPK